MTEQMTGMFSQGDYLEHFGKKGMKWGVRKGVTTNTTHTSADAARYNKINARIKSKGLDNLSNDDLAKVNKRKQLLTDYKKNNPGKLKKGQNAVKAVLEGGKTAKGVYALGLGAVAVASSPTVRKGAKAVAKALKDL